MALDGFRPTALTPRTSVRRLSKNLPVAHSPKPAPGEPAARRVCWAPRSKATRRRRCRGGNESGAASGRERCGAARAKIYCRGASHRRAKSPSHRIRRPGLNFRPPNDCIKAIWHTTSLLVLLIIIVIAHGARSAGAAFPLPENSAKSPLAPEGSPAATPRILGRGGGRVSVGSNKGYRKIHHGGDPGPAQLPPSSLRR
jgi:hypothetical protein